VPRKKCREVYIYLGKYQGSQDGKMGLAHRGGKGGFSV
jgi:hypothetical protein